jgi:hypothetical protein
MDSALAACTWTASCQDVESVARDMREAHSSTVRGRDAPSPSQENAASATEPGPSYSYVSTGHSTREIDLTLPQNKEMQISSCKRGFANSQTIAN